MDRRDFLKYTGTAVIGGALLPGAMTDTGASEIPQEKTDMTGTPRRDPKTDPFLSPENSALILIDYQPHILAGVNTMAHEKLIRNTVALVKSCHHFGVPIILSHVGVELFGAKPFIEEVTSILPGVEPLDRTNVNAWEETHFVEAVKATGRNKLIMGGLWTEVCLAYPAIEASRAGYEVYVAEDTVGGANEMSHRNGMQRMLQAGVVPITWNVVPAELQRDHARTETHDGVSAIFNEYLFSGTN